MSLAWLGGGYIGIGVTSAIVLAWVRRLTPADALLLAGLWPLYVPFLIIGRPVVDRREAELLDALARAAASPLASILPDAANARVLARQLREASTRLVELDQILARPDFDLAAAELRARELTARGATAAAATAQLRVRTLGQLRAVRVRFRGELDEVGELVSQLVTQAELVRLDPGMAAASSELVRELVARVESLGELFATEMSEVPPHDHVDHVGEYRTTPARLP